MDPSREDSDKASGWVTERAGKSPDDKISAFVAPQYSIDDFAALEKHAFGECHCAEFMDRRDESLEGGRLRPCYDANRIRRQKRERHVKI